MNGGLGVNYLDKMSDYHAENQQFAFVSYGGSKCRMPKYYKDRLIKQFNTSTKLDQDLKLQDYYSDLKNKHLARFKEWLKSHKGLSYEQALFEFNKHEKVSHDSRDELIIQHTKKQKF